MSPETPPEGATCAGHPDQAASWVCGRCGSFMCTQCEHRMRPEARPMCPACWALRSRTVAELDRPNTRLQTAGLVLGVLSLIPFCIALQLVSLVLNIVALVRAKEPPASTVRWKPITGIVLTCVGVLGTILLAML